MSRAVSASGRVTTPGGTWVPYLVLEWLEADLAKSFGGTDGVVILVVYAAIIGAPFRSDRSITLQIFSATVSDLALMSSGPSFGALYQAGTSPQRIGR